MEVEIEMAFDMHPEYLGRLPSDTHARARFILEFENDVFGPVKVLQLFAAINSLPDEYKMSPSANRDGWTVVVQTEINVLTARVLAKIQSMPTVIDFKHLN